MKGLFSVLRALKPLDFLSFALALAVVVAFIIPSLGGGGEGESVYIRAEDEEFLYPLGQDQVLSFQGPVGETVVEILDGRAQVLSSPGRQQICVRGGWIERSGEWLACLPNRIFLRVEGGGDDTIDAHSF